MDKKKTQEPQGWERAKVIATILDAAARVAEMVLRR